MDAMKQLLRDAQFEIRELRRMYGRQRTPAGPRIATLVCINGTTQTIGEHRMRTDNSTGSGEETIATESDKMPTPGFDMPPIGYSEVKDCVASATIRPSAPQVTDEQAKAYAAAQIAMSAEHHRRCVRAFVINAFLGKIRGHRGVNFVIGPTDVEAFEMMERGIDSVPKEDQPA